MKYSHFNDYANQVGHNSLYKIKLISSRGAAKKFQLLISSHKSLHIDECLLLWKGYLAFKQYVPSKRREFGIKLFVICDCQTRVVLDFSIYTGSLTALEGNQSLEKSDPVVMTLMKPYLNKGHLLFLDNWYTSSILFEKLHELKTGPCGIVSKNRLGLLKFGKLANDNISYNNANTDDFEVARRTRSYYVIYNSQIENSANQER